MLGKRHIVGKSVVRNSTRSSLILIESAVLQDADRVAKELASREGVSKVYVTSGRYGFVVFAEDKESLEIDAAFMRTVNNPKASIVKAHYVYACRAKS
jgi:hypothetical protein